MSKWYHKYKRRSEKLKELGFASYAQYLKSPHWQKIRKQRWDVSEKICNKCDRSIKELYQYELDDGGLHVHHRDYENLGQERLEELDLLCSTCHINEHDKRFDLRQYQKDRAEYEKLCIESC